jgi:hypothetical protein
MTPRSLYSSALSAACALALTASAAAAPILTTVEAIGTAGFGPRAGATLVDFDTGLPADPLITSAGAGFGLYTGSIPGLTATPFGDASQYFSVGKGTTTITFGESQDYLGLLWGSVDGYNSLAFYDGADLVGTITGNMIVNPATGNQGIGGTFYVNFDVASGFDRLVLVSTQYAFEFDDLAYGTTALRMPEPGTAALLAGGLLTLGFARRRRR